jgi:hypothetical protein
MKLYCLRKHTERYVNDPLDVMSVEGDRLRREAVLDGAVAKPALRTPAPCVQRPSRGNHSANTKKKYH